MPHRTMLDILRNRAGATPDRIAYTFLEREGEEYHLTYGELDRRARAIAAQFQRRSLQGSRALLAFPPGLGFITAYFGCLYAGVLAVPTALPQVRSIWQFENILHDSQAHMVLTSSAMLARLRSGINRTLSMRRLIWLDVESIRDDQAEEWVPTEILPESPAMLQYTSGSTTNPRGVIVTHGNLLHNSAMVCGAFQMSAGSTVVGWLPHFHDMGLVGNVLQPLYVGGRSILMAPAAFLERPLRWLQAITAYGARTSGGPDFAYRMCAERIDPALCEDVDLASWEVAFTGAEPVRSDTIELFTRKFAPFGFRRTAFYPCYGLAEATLFVTGTSPELPPTIRSFQARALEENRAVAANPGEPNARALVSCGRATAPGRVVIVDPETTMSADSGQVGEIWVSGPHVAAGYWNSPQETALVFKGTMGIGGDCFLRTGDLGFLDDGELYVTGRLKDLIIIRGRNHYPQDIEQTVERAGVLPGAGRLVAFSVDLDKMERLVVAREVHPLPAEVDGEAEKIREAIARDYELETYAVVFLPPGGVPVTSSGKVRRQSIRASFLGGTLQMLAVSFIAVQREEIEVACQTPEELALLTPEVAHLEVVGYLRRQVAALKGVPERWVDISAPIDGLGLDSVVVTQFRHAIEERFAITIPLAELMTGSTLGSLAARIVTAFVNGPVRRHEHGRAPSAPAVLPVSSGEQALWFVHQQHGGASNLAFAIRHRPESGFNGGLHRQALLDALQRLVLWHPILRSVYELRGREVVRMVRPQSSIDVAEVDASGCDAGQMLALEAGRPFNLAHDPPVRAVLFHQPDGTDLLLLVFHHIAVDLWSLVLIATELSSLYHRRHDRELSGTPLIEPRERPALRRPRTLARDESELWDYWNRKLAPPITLLQLPADRGRPMTRSWMGEIETFELPGPITQGLAAIAAERHTTPYTLLLAAFQTLLHRLSGQEEILVGSPTAGRERAEHAHAVGYFVNPVVLRGDLSGDPTFLQLLDRTHRLLRETLDHQPPPFSALVERLQPERHPNRHPFFDVAFIWQRIPSGLPQELARLALEDDDARASLGDLDVQRVRPEKIIASYDLEFTVTQIGSMLKGTMKYDVALFDRATVRRMLGSLGVLLQAVARNPHHVLSALPLLELEERRLLLRTMQGGDGAVSENSLHQLFAEQVIANPDAVALVDGAVEVNYGELDRRSNRLGHALRAAREVAGEPVVCMLADPVERIVAMLAILKAGAHFVALDEKNPAGWNGSILREVAPACIIADETSLEAILGLADIELPGIIVPRLGDGGSPGARGSIVGSRYVASFPDAPVAMDIAADLPAYIAYTSGSTGTPKGIVQTHRNLVQFIEWQHAEFGITPDTRLAQFAAITFDVAYCEIFGALCYGATLVLASLEVRTDPMEAYRWVRSTCVSLLQIVPSFLGQLLEAAPPQEQLPDLKVVLSVGEMLPVPLAMEFLDRYRTTVLYNVYGPTENIATTCHRVVHDDGARETIPVGRPIPGRTVIILDTHGHVCPIGVPGEIHIRSRYLMPGYLRREEETRTRLSTGGLELVDGDASDCPVYRTGDLGRWLEGGAMELLGRIDNQVKIRGVRLELEQIERLIVRHPDVRAAVAAIHDASGNDRRLVLYVEAPRAVHRDALHEDLRRLLPQSMLPSMVRVVERLPRLGNGKVDRRALAVLDFEDEQLAEDYSQPRVGEEEIASIWKEVLGIERIGRHDHFFRVGGHSLLAAQVVNRARQRFQVELRLAEFLREPTVAGLALLVRRAKEQSEAEQEEILRMLEDVERLPPASPEFSIQTTMTGPSGQWPEDTTEEHTQ